VANVGVSITPVERIAYRGCCLAQYVCVVTCWRAATRRDITQTYQEKLLYKTLAERFQRNICLLLACIQEKSPLKPLFGCPR
jgi:hypothetical protein